MVRGVLCGTVTGGDVVGETMRGTVVTLADGTVTGVVVVLLEYELE